MDSDVLAKALDYIKRQNLSVHSLLIIRHGYVILDAYFYPYTGESAHDLASVTKSITASLVGLALEKGYLRSLEQPVLNFFPERTVDNSSVNKGHLRIKDLLAMSSGLKCGYGPAEPELFAMLKSKDWVQFALDLPMVTKPGTEFSY